MLEIAISQISWAGAIATQIRKEHHWRRLESVAELMGEFAQQSAEGAIAWTLEGVSARLSDRIKSYNTETDCLGMGCT